MRIHDILNYNGDQRAFQSIANAFTQDGMLKYPLDLEGMYQVDEPRLDQTTKLVGDHNLNPVTQGSDTRSTPVPVQFHGSYPSRSRTVFHPSPLGLPKRDD
jgi:hypothetical protein